MAGYFDLPLALDHNLWQHASQSGRKLCRCIYLAAVAGLSQRPAIARIWLDLGLCHTAPKLLALPLRNASMTRVNLAGVVLCLFAACPALAASGYRASLFNGRDLDGWQVTGCEAVVENGLLVLRGGDGFVRTNERHADFVLELDWRARRPSNYDSGIYIRADLPAGRKPWPARYQVNLKQGAEGNIAGLAGATSK